MANEAARKGADDPFFLVLVPAAFPAGQPAVVRAFDMRGRDP